MKKKLLLIGILFLGLITIQAQDVGEAAPDFSYTDLDGTTHTLYQYKGKVVFLYALGNGCPYCKEAGPFTQSKVQAVYGPRPDFKALGIDTWNSTSSVATLGAFKSTTGITYPLLLQGGSFETLYSTSYDRVIVVDQEGIIRHKTKKAALGDLDAAVAVIESLYTVSGIGDPGEQQSAGLNQVFPNPAGEQANIRFTLESEDGVDIRIYNTMGQEISSLVNEVYPAGEHLRQFSTSGYSPGIYFIRMDVGDKTYTRKMQVSR